MSIVGLSWIVYTANAQCVLRRSWQCGFTAEAALKMYHNESQRFTTCQKSRCITFYLCHCPEATGWELERFKSKSRDGDRTAMVENWGKSLAIYGRCPKIRILALEHRGIITVSLCMKLINRLTWFGMVVLICFNFVLNWCIWCIDRAWYSNTAKSKS